jgi:8-oxo-dGTP diphosphatase
VPQLPLYWKRQIARLVRWPLGHHLLALGVNLVTVRHRIGVAAVVLDDSGRVLLLNHVFHPAVPWGLPGGWLERDEAPATAVLRELREETGLTAVLGPVIHMTREARPPHVGIAYLAHSAQGDLRLSPEIIDAAWFAPNALPPLLPFVRQAIATAAGSSHQSSVISHQSSVISNQ